MVLLLSLAISLAAPVLRVARAIASPATAPKIFKKITIFIDIQA